MSHKRDLPIQLVLEGDNTHLANFCGPMDDNLRQIAQAWGVKIGRSGNRLNIQGNQSREAANSIEIFHRRARHQELTLDDIQLGLVEMKATAKSEMIPEKKRPVTSSRFRHGVEWVENDGLPNRQLEEVADELVLRTKRSDLRPRTPRQRLYLNQILRHDITFGVGPAGTGKTWLAVACAIDALERDNVQRIILARPAVEAGERLGFLPGDLAQKVDPYLRPLYDALYDLMGFDKVQRLLEKQTIELAPLAYMRGRTLNHAFVILDEAQNTTPEQMKMFLTRIGFGSKAVITGDPSQIDLPKGQLSGLSHACQVLSSVQGIAMTEFTSQDVVRHPLVARIIDAYERSV